MTNYKRIHSFIRSHNLVNRIYNMMIFFHVLKNDETKTNVKKFLNMRLEDAVYVEDLIVYFERKKCKNKKNIDLYCNLKDLIYDLEYLKQYLI